MKNITKLLYFIIAISLPTLSVSAVTNNAPTIKVIGEQYPVINTGNTWVDAGATSADTEDGNLTSEIITSGSANTSTAGIYKILYSITDHGPNPKTATTSRYVVVIDSAKKGNPACSDGLDNDFDGLIDKNDPGCYFGDDTHTVIDPSKYQPNDNTENTVNDVIPIGGKNMTVNKGSVFTDPGIIINDQEDGPDTYERMTTSGSVNTNIAGIYKIFYTVYGLFTREINTKNMINPSEPTYHGYTQTARIMVREVEVKDIPVPPITPTANAISSGGQTILKIYDEKISKISPNSAVITWKTNTSADSFLGIGTSTVNTEILDRNQKYGYTTLISNPRQKMTQDHLVALTKLDPNQIYYLRAGSKMNTLNDVSKELTIEKQPTTLQPQTPQVCSKYLNKYIKFNAQNDPTEVKKLQQFLIDEEGENKITVNGIYDKETATAVNKFQLKYRTDILDPWGSQIPTGFVYYTTQKKINEIVCARLFPLNQNQKNEINTFKKLIEEDQITPLNTVGFNSNPTKQNSTSLFNLTQKTSGTSTINSTEQLAGVVKAEGGWQKVKNFFINLFSKKQTATTTTKN